MRRVITFGTYDLFHIGHLRLLQRAKSLGDYLIVGVSTDELNYSKKARNPVIPYPERAAIVGALKVVDEVFPEESLELKGSYIQQYKADIFVMGDDWRGKFDEMSQYCQVIYLDRTPDISSTSLKESLYKGGYL